MAKELNFNDEARKKLLNGITKVADAVKTTLGPSGKLVILQKESGSPIVSKDGVTIAKEIVLEDPVENLGASLIKEVAAKTNSVAGDNTTTSTVLAYAIVKEGIKAVDKGVNPLSLKKGIDKAVSDIVSKLDSSSRSIKGSSEIAQVATISANNDEEIGKILADAVDKVGRDGVILVEESQNTNTSVRIVNGLQWEQGYISPYFCTNKERMEVEYDDCNILITDNKISAVSDLIPIIDPIAKAGKPLLIICDDMDGEALTATVVNAIKGTLKVAVVKAPSFGEQRKKLLEDIAIVTGSQIYSDDYNTSLKKANISELGKAKVKITKTSTTITNGAGDKSKLDAHIAELKAQIDNTEDKYDKDKIKKRIARLTGGVAVISVGAPTITELKEKKFRVEDTIAATRSAIEGGVIPGGGSTLVHIAKELNKSNSGNDDFNTGYNIVLKAVSEPLKQIAENAGENGEVVYNNVIKLPAGQGFDAANKDYVDMMERGIIDTTKAIKNALINAASIASIVLNTECTITDIPKKPNEMQLEVQSQPFMM